MATLRTTIALLVAVAMVAAVPSAAGQSLVPDRSLDADCQDFYASSIPLLHPNLDVGTVEVCDEDRDGVFDTVSFHTKHAPSHGGVSVTDETKQRSDHQDRQTEAEVQFTAGLPVKPIVYQSVTVEDEGNDGQVDDVEHAGTAFTRLAAASYVLELLDDDQDRVPDGYGLTLCSTGIGCSAPGPRLVPQPPERIDLPDTVVHIDPIGYIP